MTSRIKHRPRKRFGQNFLQDAFVIQQIVEAVAPAPDDKIIEVGPGLGALTQALLTLADVLHVVELDRDLAAQLPERLGHPPHLMVHQADALHLDFVELEQRITGRALKIVGNLPYNVATPLILRLLQTLPQAERLIFMVQAEVAHRLAAKPGTKQYGRLTVMAQYFSHIQTLFEVSNQAFYPVPKVQSTVILCVPYASLPHKAHNFSFFAQLVKQAFCQRRKTMANALKTTASADQLQMAGISPQDRPEQISVSQFVGLSNLLGAVI